ncbi:hypothetical protein M2350_002027 [Candidatus Fervidibacter sacchari]|uniref:Uncharacterized protein n=1 Tax=Candidatus Fervidibacter sacchari TaxID=1448929 RepID=A0ABT2EPJ1_9BACT|nr:hypothetical protein [Candidatus Fervidibacter sacchari]
MTGFQCIELARHNSGHGYCCVETLWSGGSPICRPAT